MPSPCACRRNGTTRAMPWVVDPLENLARTASSWTGPSHGGIAQRHDGNPAFSCGLFGSRIQTKRFPSLPPPRSVCTSEPPIANARLNVPTNPFLHMRGRYVHVHLLCPRISFLPFPSPFFPSDRNVVPGPNHQVSNSTRRSPFVSPNRPGFNLASNPGTKGGGSKGGQVSMVPPGHVTPSKVRVRRTCASRRASNGEKRARKREKKEQELEPKPWWKKKRGKSGRSVVGRRVERVES